MKLRYMYGQIYIELFVKPEARRKNAQETDDEQMLQVVIKRDALETSEVCLHTNDGSYNVLRIEVQAKCRAQ